MTVNTRHVTLMHEALKIVLMAILAMSAILPAPASATAGTPDNGEWRTGTRLDIRTDETVTEHLSAAALSLNIDGVLENSSRLAGVNVRIGGIVESPAVIAAANAELSGTFLDSLTCYAANAVLSGTYDGDIEVNAAHLTITPSARINGNLQYAAAAVTGLEHATITGTVTQLQLEAAEHDILAIRREIRNIAGVTAVAVWAVSLAGLILTGMVMHYIVPGQTSAMLHTMNTMPAQATGTGFAVLLTVPVLSFLAAITLVGIPLAGLALTAYGASLYLSQAYAGLWLGRKIFRRASGSHILLPLVTGTLVIWLTGLVPLIGWLVNLFLLTLALGALWITLHDSVQSRREPTASGSAE